MKKLTFVLIACLVIFSSQTTERHLTAMQFPYNGMPLISTVQDTNYVVLSYIFFDKATNKLNVTGNLELGLRKMVEVYENTIVPAQELNYAASRVRLYLNSNGTVRRRDSLTLALRYYDSIKVKWGIIE